MRSKHLIFPVVFVLTILVWPSAAQAAPPNVTPHPLTVNFGKVGVNMGTSPAEIRFVNESGSNIEVFGFSLAGADSPNFTTSIDVCTPRTLYPGTFCVVHVYFRPLSVGVFSVSAELNTDKGRESATLTGEGAAGSLAGTAPVFDPQPFYHGGQHGRALYQNTDPFLTVLPFNSTITGPDAAFFSIENDSCGRQTLNPGSVCFVDVQFYPQEPGTKNAQLNMFNNGDPDPASVVLSATALGGPVAVPLPSEIDLGNVAIGASSAPSQVAIENQGDYELQIEQLFVVGAAPNYFSLTNDLCTGTPLPPGQKCTLDLSFTPGPSGTGNQSGSLFILTNSPGGVKQMYMTGRGFELPDGGNATISGQAMALRQVTCNAGGFPDGTDFTYEWFIRGSKVSSKHKYRVANRDVGGRLTCRVNASNPVGSSSVQSPKSNVVAPAGLTGMPGGLIGRRLCRSLQMPPRIGSANISYGLPMTPLDPLVITGKGRMTARLDGQTIADGNSPLKIPPRRLHSFANGGYELSIGVGGRSNQAEVALAGCLLSARAVLRGRATSFRISTSVGMDNVLIKARKGTSFSPAELRGRFGFKALSKPAETFLLSGRRTSSNGVSVEAGRKVLKIKGLPENSGIIRLTLDRGSSTGRLFRVQASLKASSRRTVSAIARRR